MTYWKCSHLIGCIDINSIFYMLQGLVQVARSGRSEETVACICLQEEKREGWRKGDTGCKRKTHTMERKNRERNTVKHFCTSLKKCKIIWWSFPLMSLHPWGHWWPESYLHHWAGHRGFCVRTCMCVYVCVHQWKRRKDRARVQRTLEKLRLTGQYMTEGSIVSGGFAPLERQKCCWNWIAAAAAVWGAKKRKPKNSSYIISFMQPFISSRIRLIIRSWQHIRIRKENTHLLSTSKHSLKPCCRWLWVARPLCTQRKSLRR